LPRSCATITCAVASTAACALYACTKQSRPFMIRLSGSVKLRWALGFGSPGGCFGLRPRRWLGEDYGLDARAANHLMGQVVRYDIGNVFNPAFTVACRIAKR
jgi:hypothetical protein